MAEQESGKWNIVYEECAYDPFSGGPVDPHEIVFLEDGGEPIWQNRRRKQAMWMMNTSHLDNPPKELKKIDISNKGVPTKRRDADPVRAAAFKELVTFLADHPDWQQSEVLGARLKALYAAAMTKAPKKSTEDRQ